MNLDELEKLAKAATPGPWQYHENGISYIQTINAVYGPDENLPAELFSYCSAEDGNYIAACDPQTILKLIRVARAAIELQAFIHWGMSPAEEKASFKLHKALHELNQTTSETDPSTS